MQALMIQMALVTLGFGGTLTPGEYKDGAGVTFNMVGQSTAVEFTNAEGLTYVHMVPNHLLPEDEDELEARLQAMAEGVKAKAAEPEAAEPWFVMA